MMMEVAGVFETSVYFSQTGHGVTPQTIVLKLNEVRCSVTDSYFRPATVQPALASSVSLVSVKQWTAWSLEVEPIGCPPT